MSEKPDDFVEIRPEIPGEDSLLATASSQNVGQQSVPTNVASQEPAQAPPPPPKVREEAPTLHPEEGINFEKPEAPKDQEEQIPAYSNLPLNKNSKKILDAYKPVWWFLLILGQMPFRIVKRGSGGYVTYNFQFHKVSPQTIIYGCCFVVYALCYVLFTAGIGYFFIPGYSKIKTKKHDEIIKTTVFVSLEKEIIRRGLIPLMVQWGVMTVTFLGFITVFVKGGEFVQYFNHWNRVVQVIDIDPTFKVRRFFIIQNIIVVCVVTILSLDFFAAFFIHSKTPQRGQGFDRPASVASLVTKMLYDKFYDPDNPKDDAEGQYIFTLVFFIMTYGIIASRCQIVAFLFFSQLLRNTCAIWNERLRNLLKGESVALNPAKQSNRRISYSQLLKDHLILVQLFKMTETTFGIPLLSYYLMNVFSIILELYFLINLLLQPLTSKYLFTLIKWNQTLGKFVRIVKNEADDSSLEEEIEEYGDPDVPGEKEGFFSFLIAAVIMVYQVFYTLQLTTVAAHAYEQAMKGFSILRRYGFMYCRNATERNFIHTLTISFAPNNPMRLTGGGYFPLDKALIAGMLANIINFVVSCISSSLTRGVIENMTGNAIMITITANPSAICRYLFVFLLFCYMATEIFCIIGFKQVISNDFHV